MCCVEVMTVHNLFAFSRNRMLRQEMKVEIFSKKRNIPRTCHHATQFKIKFLILTVSVSSSEWN